jgi:hypothetical protein
MSKLDSLVEGKLAEFQARQGQLVESWKPYVESATKWSKEKLGRDLTEHDKRNIAQCLENTLLDGGLKTRSSIFETTTGDAISFLGVQLPIVTAIVPSLALNHLSIVQALDRRVGSVFYMDFRAGQTKGGVSSNSVLIDPKTGHASSGAAKRYASTIVETEPQGTSTSGTLLYPFPVALTLVLVRGVETFTETSAGILTSNATGGGTGTINAAGQWTVTGWIGTGTIYATYRYYWDKMSAAGTAGVPEININMTQETVTAIDFPVRAKFSLGAAIDLEKAHGVSLESVLVKVLGDEIKFAIDHYGIEQIVAAATGADAAVSPGTFASAAGSGQEFIFRVREFLKYVELGSNAIFAKTLRGMASYLVVGNNAAAVLKQIGDHFKPNASAGKVMTGPTLIGELDGRPVVQDPFIATGRVYLGYKGDNFLEAGFVVAPYIPLFSTPTLQTSDLLAQKGFLSSVGYKVIRPGLFTYFDVTL